MQQIRPIVLSIAGYDPSSGAGITADVKTCAAHGCYATTCISALTVQTTRGVYRVEPVDPSLVSDTLYELAADLPPAAVRIGMLGSSEVALAVAAFLEAAHLPNVVLDPIVSSSSGARLLDEKGLDVLIDRILPLAKVVTPNVDEAEILTGLRAHTDEERLRVGERLLALGAGSAVVTGGHLESASDLLIWMDAAGVLRSEMVAAGPKLESRCTHGTGCAFATSVACSLAQGNSVLEAVVKAKNFVTEAIRHARWMGEGTGPVEHFWRYGIDKD